MTQIKIPPEIKREIATFASLTDRTQSDLIAEAWREYRARHSSEFRKGLEWAEEVLADPQVAAVSAAGMEHEQIDKLNDAFTGNVASNDAVSLDSEDVSAPGDVRR